MINKMEQALKRILAGALCLLCLMTTVVETIPLAYSATDVILGTNAALGSPILNNNFTINDWNKWEMICWGVFLSNFCVPLVDDYESCFMTGKGGSNGSGFAALSFGTGNDPTNNETIESLTTYAAVQQKVTQKEIYVGLTKIEGPTMETTKDPNDSQENADELRLAKFKDFFLSETPNSEETSGSLLQNGGLFELRTVVKVVGQDNYADTSCIPEGYLPTFYIRNGNGKYVKIFDYTDSWDAQMITLIINALRNNDEYAEEFGKAFQQLEEDNPEVTMDAFGNINVNGKILIPAAVNKNITRDGDINLMNSWVMNGYNSTYDNKQLSLGLRQDMLHAKISGLDLSANRFGGTPAFGESEFENLCLMYYDLDTIMINNWKSGNDIKYGDALLELFKADVKSTRTSLNLKIEMSDGEDDVTHKGGFLGLNIDLGLLSNTKLTSSSIVNAASNGTSGKRVLDYIVDMYGNKLPLYSDNGVIIANQLITAEISEKNSQAAVRLYYDFLYQIYTGTVTSSSLSRTDLEQGLSGANWDDFKKHAVDGNSIGDWFKAFTNYNSDFKDLKASDLANTHWYNVDIKENDIFTAKANRLVKAYPVSDQMRAVSRIFGVKDGVEFRQYSTMIYMTYLDFYGIASDTSATGAKTKSSGFNPELYDESSDLLNVDLNDIIDTMSDEELESEVLYYSYLMLHPERGRSYRQKLIDNSLADWVYEQYNRVVYGGYSETYNGSTSKSNSGFLSIETYTDNFLTAWFLNSYTAIAVWLIGLCTIAAIIIGILKHKKLSWFFLSILVIINSILLVPSSGDIVPYVTSNMIQGMFQSKMTYWSISQGITNAQLEADAVSKSVGSNLEDLTTEEANAVISIVKQLSSIYTDRSLMVKQDISQKVTQATVGSYSEIQSIQSARWILPMVMQQFTGDNNTSDYIYKPLANIWDDMSNMYWYFDPLDAQSTEVESHTATSDQNAVSTDMADLYNQLTNKQYFEDYDSTKSIDNISTDINCRSFAYTLNSNEEMPHLVFTYLPDSSRRAISRSDSIGVNGENYANADSWQSYIDSTSNKAIAANWMTTASGGFEETADSYDRNVRNTITSDMPYLLSTESPAYYFYSLVKDTFPIESNLGVIIGQLQGQIKKDAEGNEVRDNFMYATIGTEGSTTDNLEYTGYVRDVLDLEEMFYNVIPYLYQMQLTAGGFDGVSGVLGDEEITSELKYYEGNKMSWMYRCNWATKIMENPDYSVAYNVGMPDGSRQKVVNPALPSTYPSNRPMVFSEAQKQAMGLEDSDLTIVELKCIEANERVAKQWTLLINYAGTAGLTKEVLMRQMATDATLIFCDEFSSSGVINTMYTMYPQSLDLRYLSFDSVMKMLIMNVSKNTSYIYSDTMSTLIEDTDIITAIFLLIDAYLCAYIIPFIRTALMAIIFFLGFAAIVRSLFSSGKYKTKIACGQLIMNLAFMLYTIGYYAVYSILMAITSTDEVLRVSTIESNAGNPVWVLIIVAIFGILYTVLMLAQIKFCWKHRHDMGFEAMSIAASGIVGGISDALGGLGGKVENFFNSENSTTNNTTNTKSIKGTGIMEQEASDVNVKSVPGNTLKVEKEDEVKENVFMDADSLNGYNNLSEVENMDYMQAAEIDAEIEKGEELNID